MISLKRSLLAIISFRPAGKPHGSVPMRPAPALLAAAAILVTGCQSGSPSPPQPALILTAVWPGWGPQIVRDLNNGALSLDDSRAQADLQAAPQCTFAADYGNSPAPRFSDNGQPGTPAFNLQLITLNLNEASGLTQPCTGPQRATGVTMAPSDGIAIGARTRTGSAIFEMSNGASFAARSGVFEFTLTSLGSQTATASYRYVMTNDNDPQDTRVLVVSGSFRMPR